MAETETDSPRFSSPEQPEEVQDYRRVSSLAIISLVVAALSAVALIHPLLWIVPIAAVGLALSALRQTSRSPELAGRGVATTALIVALLFGSWGVTWVLARQALFTRQARAHVEYWFELVGEGKLREAHQLTMYPYERATESQSLEEYYTKARPTPSLSMPDNMNAEVMQATPQEELEAFFKGEPLRDLVAQNGDFEIEFLGNKSLTRINAGQTILVQRFLARFRQDGRPREVELIVQLDRNISNGLAQWRLSRVKIPDE